MPRNPAGRLASRLRLLLPLAALLIQHAAGESASPWLVRAWKTGDLPGNYVVGVSEGPDGFIWTVAGEELVRFDGIAFKPFPLRDPRGGKMPIREFTPLRGGGMALALMNGSLVRVSGGRVEVLNRDLTKLPGRVEALVEDADGSLLVSGNDESAYRLRAGRLTRFTAEDGLPPGAHCRFALDGAGQLWFAKGTQVGRLENGRFVGLRQLPADSLRLAIAPARRGGIWIAAGRSLFHLDRDLPPERIGDVGLSGTEVRPTALMEDSSGAVWCGTYASGLFRFEGAAAQSVPISHQQVLALLEDREGGIWVGTSGGGLNQVQPRAVTIVGEDVGVPSEAVQAICEDSAHELWAVTQNGLVVTRSESRWVAPAGFALGNATSIAADAAGSVWIGSKNGRLYRWSAGRLSTWGPAEGMSDLPIRILTPAKSGDLWIGSSRLGSSRPGEVRRLRAGKIESIALTPRSDLIRAIAEDAEGGIWIAGVARRLWRIDPRGQITAEPDLIPNPPQQVHLMATGPDGTLWIGYDKGGIGRIKDGRLGRITMQNGLWDDRIDLILPDGRGWLWLAANQALFKISEDSLAAVAEGRARQVKCIRYGQDQGVRATFGESVGALRRSDGRLWIPMATSLAIIDPAQTHLASGPPPVVIAEVRVDDQVVATHPGFAPSPAGAATDGGPLRVSPGHRRLDIDFAALSFSTPSNVLFRYRLDGFDDRWIDGGAARTVSYSRLPAGDYRFHVTACNSDGVWNEAGAALAFTVTPFVWDTWWFRAAGLAVFTAGIFALARYASFRRLQLKLRAAERETAVERERARIARDIHDELGSRLNKIVLLTGLAARAREAPEDAERRVWEISQTARQLLSSLDETVWAVDPRNDNLPNLIDYLGEFAVSFMRTAEIHCHVDLPVNPPARAVSADVRHNLSLAVKETLNNIVRHAQASVVWLRIAVSDSALSLTIEDNGRGFTGPASQPGSDGLRNLRQRMGQLGARVEINSRPNEGTRVSFLIPWVRQP